MAAACCGRHHDLHALFREHGDALADALAEAQGIPTPFVRIPPTPTEVDAALALITHT